jgi:hypothetical protein
MPLVLLLLTTPVTVLPVPAALQPTPAVEVLLPVPATAATVLTVLVPTAVFRLLLLAPIKLDVAATGITLTALEDGLIPIALVAMTEQLYAVPLVSGLTVIGLDALVAVLEAPLPVQVAVYPVIAEPPLLVGAVNAMLAEALPAVAAPMVGAAATVAAAAGVTPAVLDAAPVPTTFVAVTEQLYAVPLVNAPTLIGLVLPVAVFEVPPPVHVAV